MSSVWFVQPAELEIGSLVWYFRTDVLIGPLLIVDKRRAGYGGNGHIMWIMYDTRSGDYHQAAQMWLRVPKEEECN